MSTCMIQFQYISALLNLAGLVPQFLVLTSRREKFCLERARESDAARHRNDCSIRIGLKQICFLGQIGQHVATPLLFLSTPKFLSKVWRKASSLSGRSLQLGRHRWQFRSLGHAAEYGFSFPYIANILDSLCLTLCLSRATP